MSAKEAVQGLTEAEQAVLKIPGEFFARSARSRSSIVALQAAHRAHPDLVPNKSGTPI